MDIEFAKKDFYQAMIKQYGKLTLGYTHNLMRLEAGDSFISHIRRTSYAFEKRRLWIAQNGICYWCGKQCIENGNGGKPTEFTVDHVIPLAVHGTNHWMNLVGACAKCNNHRGKVWGRISLVMFKEEYCNESTITNTGDVS